MSNIITFSSWKSKSDLSNKNVKPDENGYYKIILGALNTTNTKDDFYVLNASKELFAPGSRFMRRVENGYLRAELGHPKRQPGQTDAEFVRRYMTIEETNVCAHIKTVWLDYDTPKKLKNYKPGMVLIWGMVKPSGVYGHVLKDMLDNPDENVAFSIRSVTKDVQVNGIWHKSLSIIISFDVVNEGGIPAANKWDTLSGESDSVIFLEDFIAPENVVSYVVESELRTGTESSAATMQEIFDLFATNKQSNKSNVVTKW